MFHCSLAWRLLSVLLLSALAGVLLPVWGQEPARKKYALLVGVNRYDHPKLKPLKYAENDATDLAGVLRKAGYQVVLLTGSARTKGLRPTKGNIEARLRQVLRKCRSGDTALVALAGHGLHFAGKDDSYFCPSDARPFSEETDTLVSLKHVYKQLDRSFAGVKLLLVDACRDDPRAGRGSRGIDGDTAPRPPSGVGALFSCRAGQRAFEDDELKHGVFFYYVLKGLRGAAKESDNEVTFLSLASYVTRQVSRDVPKRLGARQEPSLNTRELAGSAVLLAVTDAGRTSPRPADEDTRVARPKPVLPRPTAKKGRATRNRTGGGKVVLAEEKWLKLINKSRAREKLPPLKRNAMLFKIARDHADYLVRQQGLRELNPLVRDKRAVAAGYEGVSSSVTIDPNSKDIEEEYEEMMKYDPDDEDPYRRKILSPKLRAIGLGVARDKKRGVTYYVQLFAGQRRRR
jgi:uncharacterized protein YkwD